MAISASQTIGSHSFDNLIYFEMLDNMNHPLSASSIQFLPTDLSHVSGAEARQRLQKDLEILSQRLSATIHSEPKKPSTIQRIIFRARGGSVTHQTSPSADKPKSNHFRGVGTTLARSLSLGTSLSERSAVDDDGDNDDDPMTSSSSALHSITAAMHHHASDSAMPTPTSLSVRRSSQKSTTSSFSVRDRHHLTFQTSTLPHYSPRRSASVLTSRTDSMSRQGVVGPSGRLATGLPPIHPTTRSTHNLVTQGQEDRGVLSHMAHRSFQDVRYSTTPRKQIDTGNANLQRPSRCYVLHRHCQLAKMSPAAVSAHVAILYSGRCPVSAEWANYISKLLRLSVDVKAQCRAVPEVTCEEVETFSNLLISDDHGRNRLHHLEEVVAHARLQIVILSHQFLEWCFRNPSLLIGNLLVEPCRVIGLLLGIKRSQILKEHRTTLLTFSDWFCVMDITEDSVENEALNSNNNNNNKRSRTESSTLGIPSPEYNLTGCASEDTGNGDPNLHPAVPSNDSFSLKLHRSAVQILQNPSRRIRACPTPNLTPPTKLKSRLPISPEKTFLLWPLVVALKRPSTRMLIHLSRPVKTPEDICEVSFTACDESNRKESALCKQLNMNLLEIVVPQIIMGSAITKRCQVQLCVNGETWMTKCNTVELKVTDSLDDSLAAMVTKCIPKDIFRNCSRDVFTEPDLEVPTLLHWAAKNGLPRMAKTLMTFPDSHLAAARLNSQLLNAADLAHRHGHLEVGHLLRQQGYHTYEYPNLPARPSSATLPTPLASDSRSGSPRRISDPGYFGANSTPSSYRSSMLAQIPSSGPTTPEMTMENVVFEGPIIHQDLNQLGLYDTPRNLDIRNGGYYDIPPRPVPVVCPPSPSTPVRPKRSAGYVSMQGTPPSIKGEIQTSHHLRIIPQPQSRSEVLSDYYSRNSPTDPILSPDKSIIERKTEPPIGAFEPVIIPDKKGGVNMTVSPGQDAIAAGSSSKDGQLYSRVSKPQAFTNLIKKSLMATVSGTLKRKKKCSLSVSKISLENSPDSPPEMSSVDDTSSMMRKRSQSSIVSVHSSGRLSPLIPNEDKPVLSSSSSSGKSSPAFEVQSELKSDQESHNQPTIQSENSLNPHDNQLSSSYDVPRQLHPDRVVVILENNQRGSDVTDKHFSSYENVAIIRKT